MPRPIWSGYLKLSLVSVPVKAYTATDSSGEVHLNQLHDECKSRIQYKQYKGKQVRTFKVEMAITLVADDVETINLGVLASYLSYAMRIDMENSVHGDGPVAGSFVKARLRLKTLEETRRHRRKF